jgi:hypothetical protein
MSKKLVCFNDESLIDLEMLQAVMKMNRSELIRYLIQEKAGMVRSNMFLDKKTRINQVKSEDIPIKDKERVLIE